MRGEGAEVCVVCEKTEMACVSVREEMAVGEEGGCALCAEGRRTFAIGPHLVAAAADIKLLESLRSRVYLVWK